ncbi:unnamed protein product [Phytomonas sp. Hart1]|nr:unnamed protein product [Phytomonas sp. Hart1]|eukprot:CCW71194.1 unnamed protein product [Phytomonas sp. isolate Hart1]
MNLDPQIVPVINSMQENLEKIQKNLLPKLDELDEDIVVSYYSLEEQARLFLSAAFAASLAMYSLDKLQNRAHHQGNSNAKRVSEGSEIDSGVDLQLSLKIERITDYIKKLREITNLANSHRRLEEQNSVQEKEKGGGAKKGESISAMAKKRPRNDPTNTLEVGDVNKGRNAKLPKHGVNGKEKLTDASELLEKGDLGDDAMFRVVSRIPGETGLLVSRLLKNISAANSF